MLVSRFGLRRALIAFAVWRILPSMPLSAAELQPITVAAWEDYIRLTEARIQSELESGPFLASEYLPPSDATEARNTIRSGKVYITEMQTRNEEGKELDIPKGRIHHWLGVILVRGANIDYVLDWVKDCRNFETAVPQVVDSREISRQGDTLRMFLEIKGGRIRTAYYNTEHVVEYEEYGPGRIFSRTQATKIAELEDAGTPNEREKPEGNDSGYLWRWNSYWRYLQTEDGVILECESISLSRTIPVMFRWLINLLTKTVPKEALETTLQSIGDALERSRARAAAPPRLSPSSFLVPSISSRLLLSFRLRPDLSNPLTRSIHELILTASSPYFSVIHRSSNSGC